MPVLDGEPVFTTDFIGKYTEHWLRILQPWIGKPYVRALQVGVFEGRASLWFCDHILTGPECRLDDVDGWWPGFDYESRYDANIAGYGQIRKLKGHSGAILPQLTVAGERYDWIYVDGDHRGWAALRDLCDAWRLLKPGGVLMADDYRHTGPKGHDFPAPPGVAIDCFRMCYRSETHHTEEIVAPRRRSSVLPAMTPPQGPTP